MLSWGTTTPTEPEQRQFDKGLIFVKETDILFSGDKWTIVVNIALEDYESLVGVMGLVLGQVHRNIQVHKNPKDYAFDIHWEEINRLEKMNGELEHDLNNFKQLLFQEEGSRNPIVQGKRTRRGLINVLGYGLKYLFGTADAKDVKRLTAVCDELHTFETQVMHATDQQVTYLRTLGDMTKQNTGDTIELARALRDTIKNFSLQMYRDEADLLDTQSAIEKQVRYSSAIREIEMAILEIKFKLTQLQESLDLTSLGKLSSVLISPYNLSVILQQVSLKLPQGMSMLTGLSVEDVRLLYSSRCSCCCYLQEYPIVY